MAVKVAPVAVVDLAEAAPEAAVDLAAVARAVKIGGNAWKSFVAMRVAAKALVRCFEPCAKEEEREEEPFRTGWPKVPAVWALILTRRPRCA